MLLSHFLKFCFVAFSGQSVTYNLLQGYVVAHWENVPEGNPRNTCFVFSVGGSDG